MKPPSRSSAPPTGEDDLLARYRAGDGQAFKLLVDAYRDRMLQFFYRLCWDRGRAEDLTQELFLKLLLASKQYRPEGRMATFVYRVATNLWIDRYRQQRPRPKLQSLDQVLLQPAAAGAPTPCQSTEESPLQRLADSEERAALRAALEGLTEPHRLVFELAVYQQRPYAEISELLGIPIGTVKSRMHHAVAVLKERMGAAQEAPPGIAAGRRPRGGQ